jgi:hypothetical protein
MLVACPAHLPIGRMWLRWMRTITGKPYRHKVITTKRIAGTLSAPFTVPAAYHQNLFKTVAYVCKGVRSEDAAGLGLQHTEYGSRVLGKRAAVCPALLKLCRDGPH